MNSRWRKLLSLLLSLATVLSLLPAGFALETAEETAESVSSETEEAEEAEETEEAEEAEPAAEADPAEEAQETEGTPETDAAVRPAGDEQADADVPTDESTEPEEETPEDADSLPSGEPDEDAAAQDGLPVQGVPEASGTSGAAKLLLNGTQDYAAAAQALSQINSALKADSLSILSMDELTQECAMLRAAELAVCYDAAERPTGEAWTTVLGDAGSTATVYTQAIAYDVSAEEAADAWLSDSGVYAYLSSESIRSVGIGCFYQADGTQYWVLIATNRYTGQSSRSDAVSGDAEVAYQADCLGQAKLSLSAAALTLGSTGQSTFTVSNGKGSFTPAQEEISYTSSDPSVVTVDEQGKLTTVAPGKATITAELEGTDLRAAAAVQVKVVLGTVKLKALYNRSGKVYLTWEAADGANAYQVWRKISGKSWEKLGTPVTGTSYTDGTCASGTKYVYTVRAQYYKGGEISTANCIAQGGYDTKGLTIRYLSTPKLTSAAASSLGITVKWKSVTGAASYDVYRKTLKTGWVKIGNGTGTSYLDSNVTAKTEYYYTVRAKNGSDQSFYSVSGISATASATVATETCVVIGTAKYYTSASTSGKAAGQLSAGTKISVVKGSAKKSGGVTWYVFISGGASYYIKASSLLGTAQITSVANANGGLKITWGKVSGADGYYLYQKGTDGKWKRIAAIQSGSTVSYLAEDSALTTGTRYTYTIRAYAGKVWGDYSNTGVSAVYIQTPKLVSAVSNGKDQITLTWQKVEGATGYTVYRKTSGSSWVSLAKISSGSTVTYQDKAVKTLTGYTYTVRASLNKNLSSYSSSGITGIIIPAGKTTTCVVISDTKYRTSPATGSNTAGTLKAGTRVQVISSYSKTANGIVWSQIIVGGSLRYMPASSLLAAPKLAKLTASGSTLVLTWNKVSNATGYLVYRKTAGSTKWSQVAAVKASVRSYTDDSISSGTTYSYTVIAKYNSVRSSYDHTGLSLCYLTMPKLTGITAAKSGITVQWSRVTGAAGYRIYRKSGSGSWTLQATVKSGSTLSYQDTKNLIKGVNYTYTVQAYSGDSLSFYSGGGISAMAVATVNPNTKSYVTLGDVNYRDMSTDKVVGTLKKGTTVQVIVGGTVTVGGTKRETIYFNGNCYYVSAKWLKAK